jgi:carbamoyl-phosphate synthase large subunit
VAQIRQQRIRLGLVEEWEAVPVSGVENACYYFSTYNARLDPFCRHK